MGTTPRHDPTPTYQGRVLARPQEELVGQGLRFGVDTTTPTAEPMSLAPAEIGLIVLAVMLLFGYKKLPDASRSLGRSPRIFTSEVDELRESAPTETEGGQSSGAVLADGGALARRFGVAEVGEPAAQDPVQMLGTDDLARWRPGPRVGEDGTLLRSAEAPVGADVRFEW
jgi:sec-independent protein translocase protein TatA